MVITCDTIHFRITEKPQGAGGQRACVGWDGRARREGWAPGGGVIGKRLEIKAGHSSTWMPAGIFQREQSQK